MSDNAMNIPDDAPSDVQEESPTSLFILQRGATRREVNASEADILSKAFFPGRSTWPRLSAQAHLLRLFP